MFIRPQPCFAARRNGLRAETLNLVATTPGHLKPAWV
jgi:hypothetical protein